jgi:hypothetical protein
MRLKTVTITGADDAVDPEELLQIQQRYPFVEWGILLSRYSLFGMKTRSRYPTQAWIDRVKQVPALRLSAHLCGSLVKQVGQGQWPADLDVSWARRCQLNMALCVESISTIETVARALNKEKTWIIQVGKDRISGVGMARGLAGFGFNIHILLDASCGRGVRPVAWPRLESGIDCGVAGGLNPENLLDNLNAMASVYDPFPAIGIDIESGVRSDPSGSDQMDFTKVRQVLQIAKDWNDSE